MCCGCRLDRAGAEARVGGELCLQPGEVGLDEGGVSAFDDDLGGVGVLRGKGSLQGEVALFGGQVVGQGGDAAGADVQAEDGGSAGEHQPDAEDEAEHGPAQDGLDD